jgi:glycosyltransferase involved in cell wall biosynthesis
MKKNINIGAAIIVKNEANNIKRCLESIKNICKQIVIVDTGSDDTTPIIAANYGADIFFHKWQNDFSDARNFAIGHLYTE